MTGEPQRTLVVHVGGIGDFILTWPALAHLAREGSLEVAGAPERMALAVHAGVARAAHDLDATGFSSLFSGTPSPTARVFLGRYARVVVWMAGCEDAVEALRSCGAGDVRAFPGKPPPDWRDHASAYFCDCLEVPRTPMPPLAFPRPARGAPVTPPYAVIHPGSGGPRKRWPMERFAEAAAALRRRGLNVLWSQGPAEEDRGAGVTNGAVLTVSLTELAGVLAGARLYIGNDSGVTHLAAAAGCSTLAVFGPTDPAVWAPMGAHCAVAVGDPWPAPEAVIRAMDRLLEAVRPHSPGTL